LISINPLETKKNERVGAFQIRLVKAGFRTLPHIPMGWQITIDNNPSWNTTLEGRIGVGAAALELAELKDFVIIEELNENADPREFDIQMELLLTDFNTERVVRLQRKDLTLRPLPNGE
jgi:hypothetical protein